MKMLEKTKLVRLVKVTINMQVFLKRFPWYHTDICIIVLIKNAVPNFKMLTIRNKHFEMLTSFHT